MGRHQSRLLRFALRYPAGWHPYGRDLATVRAVRALAAAGFLRLNEQRQFQIATGDATQRPPMSDLPLDACGSANPRRPVFILATAANAKVGASVYGSRGEALDAAAEWARAHFDYDGAENLADIRGRLDAAFVAGEGGDVAVDIVEDFLGGGA